jgi:hypothetical protein
MPHSAGFFVKIFDHNSIFIIEYLRDPWVLFAEKTEGQKSRDTVPLRHHGVILLFKSGLLIPKAYRIGVNNTLRISKKWLTISFPCFCMLKFL